MICLLTVANSAMLNIYIYIFFLHILLYIFILKTRNFFQDIQLVIFSEVEASVTFQTYFPSF